MGKRYRAQVAIHLYKQCVIERCAFLYIPDATLPSAAGVDGANRCFDQLDFLRSGKPQTVDGLKRTQKAKPHHNAAFLNLGISNRAAEGIR